MMQDQSRGVIIVVDTGIGIETHNLPKLFRIDNPSVKML